MPVTINWNLGWNYTDVLRASCQLPWNFRNIECNYYVSQFQNANKTRFKYLASYGSEWIQPFWWPLSRYIKKSHGLKKQYLGSALLKNVSTLLNLPRFDSIWSPGMLQIGSTRTPGSGRGFDVDLQKQGSQEFSECPIQKSKLTRKG